MKNTAAQKERSSLDRRNHIKTTLENSSKPVTAAHFAGELSVSRQIIVSDIAIMRASGMDILATSKGYVLSSTENSDPFPFTGIIACKHSEEQLRDELYTIVDFGATVIDVSIEHSIYGELSAKLGLSSRYDVDQFVEKVNSEKNSAPISSLTGGVHLHKIGCRDKDTFPADKRITL